jgi:GAF domain-containing protein
MGQDVSIADRYRAVLKVNQIALTSPTTEAVFQGMCAALKTLVRYDRAGITLYDPYADGLRLIATYGPHENSIFRIGHLLGRKDTQTGWTFEHQQRTIRRDLRKELRFPFDRHTLDEGYRSLCSVPLLVRGSSIGVVSIIGARSNQFSSRDADILQEMSNQIALAISSLTLQCPTHVKTRLVCPRCIGAAGGKKTVTKHRDALSIWGKKGGRGRKNLDFS